MLFRNDIDKECVYVILSGLIVGFALTEEGDQIILGLFGSGSTLGESETFSLEKSPYVLEPLTEVTACSIPMEHLLKLADGNPDVMRKVIILAAGNMGMLCRYTWVMNARTVYDRVKRLLCLLANLQPSGPSEEVHVDLSHEDIAFILNTDRPSVTRALKRVSEEGLVTLRRHSLNIDASYLIPDSRKDLFPYPSWRSARY